MSLSGMAKNWLADIFRFKTAKISPDDINSPPRDATLQDHVSFLIEARNYVQNHPVPEDRKGKLNQYRHNPESPSIHADLSRPALTNCSYEHFNTKRISIGLPLFIEEAAIVKNDRFNPAFNSRTLWNSLKILIEHKLGSLGNGDTKVGYYLPTNHRYAEQIIPQETLSNNPALFNQAQKVIEFYVRSTNTNPQTFLSDLDEALGAGPSQKPIQKHTLNR